MLKQECPNDLRRNLWGVASGGFAAIQAHPGYYQRLLNDFIEYPNPAFNQIDIVSYL